MLEERMEADRGVETPLDPSIPQGEREGAPEGDPSIRSPRRPTQGERKKRGGGPKTEEGKAIVRRNPIKHGVLAQTPVIPQVEREEDWVRLRQGVFDFFELEGPLLESLGDRAAMLIWRLYRAARFETEAVRYYLDDVPDDWYTSLRIEGRQPPPAPTKADVEEMNRMLMARLLPGEEMMEKVLRYETKLHRYLLQTLNTIMVLKGLRTTGRGRHQGLGDIDPPGTRMRVDRPPL